MNLNVLEKGMIFKSYKEMCCAIGIKCSKSGNKKTQVNELSRFFRFEKIKGSQNVVVCEIYDTPKEKMTVLRNNISKDKQFDVDFEDAQSPVVYKIQLGNVVYIGSTVDARQRYLQHKSEKSVLPKVKEMMDEGAIFSVLFKYDLEDFELLRAIEQIYIDYYLNETQKYHCLNSKSSFNFKAKNRKKSIKVRAEDYKRAVEILKQSNVILL